MRVWRQRGRSEETIGTKTKMKTILRASPWRLECVRDRDRDRNRDDCFLVTTYNLQVTTHFMWKIVFAF